MSDRVSENNHLFEAGLPQEQPLKWREEEPKVAENFPQSHGVIYCKWWKITSQGKKKNSSQSLGFIYQNVINYLN